MTPRSVRRRLFVGTASNVVGKAVSVLVGLILAPIVVHSVGVTDFGIWVLVGSIAGLSILLDAGIAAGLLKFVAEFVARDDPDEAARMVGAATWLYGLVGTGVIVIGVPVAWVLPSLLGADPEVVHVARWLGVIAAVGAGLSLPAVVPVVVLKAVHRFPLVNAIESGSVVVGALLTVAALVAGAGIIGVAAAGLVNSLLTYAVSMTIARRVAPRPLAVLVRRDGVRARRLFVFSRSIAVVQVAITMQSRLDTLIVGATLPLRLVAPYSFAQRLADGTRTATEQFGRVLLPLASEVSVTREPAALRELFVSASRITMAIALAVGLPLALCGGDVLELWVGPEFAGYGVLVALLALAAIADLPSYPAAALLQAIGRHGPIAWMALGSGAANLVLSLALVGPLGLEGVALGTLIAGAVEIGLFVVPYAGRVLGVSLGDYLRGVVLPLALPAIVLCGVLLGATAVLPLTTLLRLIVDVGVAVAAYTGVYLLVGASAAERDGVRSAVAAVRAKAARRPTPERQT